MSMKKTALTAALCLMGVAAFSQVYVIEPQNYSIPQGPDAQITTGATIPPAQIDLPAPNIPPPPQVPPSMTTIYSNFSDTPQPVQQNANGPSQQVAPPYGAMPVAPPQPQQSYAPPPRTSVYSNYPELPHVMQQSAYSTPEGASPPQQSYSPPPRTSVYSNYADLPYITQQSTNGTSQQVTPPYYGNTPPPQQPYSPPPSVQPQQPSPLPIQLQAQQPYAAPPDPLPPQFPQQLPFSGQQLYAPPGAEFPRDFPAPTPTSAPAPAPSYTPPAPVYTNKTYRLQVGAFKSVVHAQYVYDAVSATGLSPALENVGDLYRVVVPYVPESNLHECVEILRMAGFAVWVREE
jgi:hypothetical protein